MNKTARVTKPKKTTVACIYDTEISEFDCANAYSHLHHADILKLLERARLAAMSDAGRPNESFLKEGLFLIVSDLSVNYLRELKVGKISVHTSCLSLDEKRMLLSQTALNVRGKVAVQAEIGIMCLHADLKRAVPIPQTLLEIFGNPID